MDTIQDLRDQLAAAERALVETHKRIKQEQSEASERMDIERRLEQIAQERQNLARTGWDSAL
jgi:hypothetical protein